MRFTLIHALLVFSFCISAQSQIIQLSNSSPYQNIGKQVTYLIDESAQLSIKEVKSLDSEGKFTQSTVDILNFGNTSHASWIKIRYQNTTKQPAYLVVDVPNIEHADLYINRPDGSTSHISSGVLHKSTPTARIANNIIFTLSQSTDVSTPQDIYLRIKSNNIILLPIKLTVSNSFSTAPRTKDQLEYMYIGILFTLFFFNIFLFISFWDKTYLYYSLYVLSLFTYVILYLRGYSYIFGYDFRIAINQYPHGFLALSLIISIFFCRKFLNLEKVLPGMIKYYNVLIVPCLMMLVLSIMGYKSISAYFAQFNSFTTLIVLWFSGVVAYRKGHKPAKYFIFAWFFIGFSVLVYILSLEGIIETNDYTFELIPVCSTIELLLLSFALGDRFRVLLKNERAVRDENLLLIQNQNQSLEELAEKRTVTLRDTIVQLEASNEVKNKLFSIIAHDLRSPFNSLISIFALKDMDLLTFDELKTLLNENKKNIETIHTTLDNLLYWAKSQMEGIRAFPIVFVLNDVLNELLLIYEPLIQRKDISAKIKMDGIFSVYADLDQVKLILRNLIDNAIKFTPSGKHIEITLVKLQDMVKISVVNTICKTNNFDAKKILFADNPKTTHGTAQEKGVGLGLLLCREYVKGNGSALEIQHFNDKVLFSFQLPHSPSLELQSNTPDDIQESPHV